MVVVVVVKVVVSCRGEVRVPSTAELIVGRAAAAAAAAAAQDSSKGCAVETGCSDLYDVI